MILQRGNVDATLNNQVSQSVVVDLANDGCKPGNSKVNCDQWNNDPITFPGPAPYFFKGNIETAGSKASMKWKKTPRMTDIDR